MLPAPLQRGFSGIFLELAREIAPVVYAHKAPDGSNGGILVFQHQPHGVLHPKSVAPSPEIRLKIVFEIAEKNRTVYAYTLRAGLKAIGGLPVRFVFNPIAKPFFNVRDLESFQIPDS